MATIHYTFKDTAISEKEAAALITVTATDAGNPPVIELSNHYKLKNVTASKLLKAAVEQENESLCTLAYRLTKAGLLSDTQEQEEAQPTRKYTRLTQKKSADITHKIPENERTPERVIDELLACNSQWVLGVCTIVVTLDDINKSVAAGNTEQAPTLKYIAELAANGIYQTLRDDFDPKYLKGFVYDNEKQWWVANTDSSKGDLYTSAYMYASLRMGVRWGVAHNLFSVELEYSKYISNPTNGKPKFVTPCYYTLKMQTLGGLIAREPALRQKIYEIVSR